MTTKKEVKPNITAEQLTAALQQNRLVAVERMGKGETDYIDLYEIGPGSYQLRRIIGEGFSYKKDCFPVGGGGYNKVHHVVEVIARQLEIGYVAANYQTVQRIPAP